jgi:hypothetical protein
MNLQTDGKLTHTNIFEKKGQMRARQHNGTSLASRFTTKRLHPINKKEYA